MFPASARAPTVKATLFNLLGNLARYFPSALAGTEEQLLRLMIRIADNELVKNRKKPELPLAAGALTGLQYAIHSFPDLGGEGNPLALQRESHACTDRMP